MTSFLFWNVMKNGIHDLVAQAAGEREVDILMLAESQIPDADLVAALKVRTGDDFVALCEEADKVRIYTRTKKKGWRRRQTDNLSARMAIWSVQIGKAQGFLLVVMHFVSKTHATDTDQALLAVELAKEINRIEDTVGHQRTVVVGDLNMDPYEEGVTAAPALHAVMTKRLAAREERTVQGSSSRFFYNPTWGFYGDTTKGPPGTYYHRSSGVGSQFWHVFDQVLLRPTLMDRLQDLAILERIGTEELLSRKAGIPQLAISDHLPLAFRLNLE